MNTTEYERMYRLEDTYWWFVGRHKLVENVMRAAYPEANPQRLILDAGCGTGAMSIRLKQWGRVVSADFSPLALQFSRRRGLNHLLCADAMCLPFEAGTFDAIVSMDVLEHIPDDALALREFYRVLKSGGRVVLMVPAYPHLWSEHDVALMHFRRYRRAELEARFTEAGFRIEKLSHTMTTLYPLVSLQRKLNAKKPPHDPPQANMPQVSAPLNSALTGLLALENAVARRVNFPFGVTLLGIAVK